MKLPLATVETFLSKIWKMHIIPWNLNTPKEICGNVGPGTFIVYLNFNAPRSTPKRLIQNGLCIGHILLNLNLKGIGNWKSQIDSWSTWFTVSEKEVFVVLLGFF